MASTDVQPTESGGEAPETDRKQWIALVVLLIAVFMDMLDGNLVSVAAPSIQHDIGADYAAIQWMTAGYVLTFALTLITGGRLGDIYGRKRVFQLGVLGFTVMSLLCGLAANPEMLVAARLLQGVMAGLMVPQVLSIIHVTFPPAKQPTVFAVYGTVGGLAATMAPLIGGVLVDLDIAGLSWRPIFLMNVPIGIAGAVMGWRYISESKAAKALGLDLVGVLLATAGLLLLLYPLTQGRELGWPLWCYVSMALSALVFVGFVLFERRKEQQGSSPLVALGLFRSRSFVAGQGLQLAVFVFTGAFFLSWYLFMQIGLGWSPLHAGSTALAFCFGAFVTSALSVTVLVPKFGRVILQAGALTLVAGLGVFLWTVSAKGGDIGTWHMVPPLVVIGLGFGLVAPPIPVFALTEVPHADAGSASGLINTMQQLGLTLGIALVSVVFFNPLGHYAGSSADDLAPRVRQEMMAAGIASDQTDAVVASFRDCVVSSVNGDDADEVPESCRSVSAVQQNPKAVSALVSLGQKAGAESFAQAFRPAVVTTMVLMLATFVLSFALPRRARENAPAAVG